METKLKFKLTRPAKKSGGDRYEYGVKGNRDFMTFYVPQEISRPEGTPLKSITLTITIEE